MNAATAAIWHDVECGSYAADLPLWEELAERCGGSVLELGCGTGRVALHLARRGHPVIGLDRDPQLLAVLRERVSDSRHSGVGRESDAPGGLVETLLADAGGFELPEQAGLVLAPMQFLQLLDDADRLSCLGSCAGSLAPGGLLAAAIVEDVPASEGPLPPLPDVREVGGWIYSSLPVAVDRMGGPIVLRRLRQTVSPDGELRDEESSVELRALSAAALEADAAEAGFAPAGRRWIAPTEAHVGSHVVLLEKVA